MELLVGPLRLTLAAGTPLLRRALDDVLSAWPARAADAAVPIRCTTDVRLREQPGRLARERPEVREGDPAAGPWRRGKVPLWLAEGDGLRSVDLHLLAPASPALAAYGLRQFLRCHVTEALLALGGLPLHAAAVARAGRAVVFLAPSGGGKTTLARSHGGEGLLSDDLALVVPGPGGPWVVPSPFPGREGTPAPGAAAPLALLVDLVKGRPAGPDRLPRTEAVERLVLGAKVAHHAREVRERVLDAALGLARSPGVLRLGLPVDRSPWALLDVP